MGIFQVNGQIQTRGNGLGIINNASFATKLTLSEEQLWARGHYFIINDAEIGSYGLYGRGTTSYYYWVGQNMYAPWMKVEPNGTITATKFVGSLQGNADTASLLSIHNTVTNTSTRSVSASSWDGSVSGLKYVWGQAFKDTSIGADTGDLILGLRAGKYTSGSTELCMMIDGDYYSLGNKVLHAGNYTSYTVTKTGSGASGTWGINISGNAATATKLTGLTASVNELNYISGATSNIQDQLTENANSISTLTATVSNKVDKVSGKGLSTNDYTTNEKNKLAGIAAGANKTTVDSALSSTSTNPVQNKVVNAAITNAAEVSVGTTQPTSSNVKVWYDTSARTVKTKVKNGNTFTELQGVSGVYVGTGTMPSGYNVQINPAGDATTEFAPAGYGLGTEVVRLGNKSVDSITGNGFYFGYVGLPELFGNSFILHLDFGNYCQQLVFSLSDTTGYGNLFIRRQKNGGIWGEWEWENPLMVAGIEYRTTERWNGKPVYVKMVDFGNLPNTSTKIKESVLPTNITAISATGYAKTATTSKIITGSDVMIEVNNDVGHIICTTRANISGSNAYITVKYIKN